MLGGLVITKTIHQYIMTIQIKITTTPIMVRKQQREDMRETKILIVHTGDNLIHNNRIKPLLSEG